MKLIFALILVLSGFKAFAGGSSEDVKLLSLAQIKEDEYTLIYKSLESGKKYTIYLSYGKAQYRFKAKFLTLGKFREGIKLLKEQLANDDSVRFGWFGGGPCVIDKSKEVYRSDALEIYNEGHPDKGPFVVYAFCNYR